MANRVTEKLCSKNRPEPINSDSGLADSLAEWAESDTHKIDMAIAFMQISGASDISFSDRNEFRDAIRKKLSVIGDAVMAQWDEKHGTP